MAGGVLGNEEDLRAGFHLDWVLLALVATCAGRRTVSLTMDLWFVQANTSVMLKSSEMQVTIY